MTISLQCDFDRPNNWLKETTKRRNSLFFDRWEWSVMWHQPEITVLRDSIDLASVLNSLRRRQIWEKTRWDNSNNDKRLRPTFRSAITQTVCDNVEKVRQWLETNTAPVKTVYYSGQIVVYADSRATVDALCELATNVAFGRILVIQALPTLPANTVCLKKPYDYCYRTYFRTRQLADNSKEGLSNWISNMGDAVKPSPGLQAYLRGQVSKWYSPNLMRDHYFVDHNDAKLDVWISMISPGLVRKTMPIVSAINK